MVIPKNKTQAQAMMVELNKQIRIRHVIIKGSKNEKEIAKAKKEKTELEMVRRKIIGYKLQYERGVSYDDLKVWWDKP